MGHRMDDATFAHLLRSCGNQKALSKGKCIHDCIIKSGLDGNNFLGNLLVRMYGNCGILEDAFTVFTNIHEKDQFAWNFIVGAHVGQGWQGHAFTLFEQMLQESVLPDKCTFLSILCEAGNTGIPIEGKRFHASVMNNVLFGSDGMLETTLINMYGKCGNLSGAQKVFSKMHEQDVVAWNAIIAVYAQQNQGKDVLRLFEKMQLQGILPNKTTFVSVLSSFDSQEAVTHSKQLHARILSSELELDIVVGTALVNMYCKAQNLENAKSIFDRLLEPDLYAWNVMITGYAQEGEDKDAFQLFGQMLQEGTLPDQVTFCSLLPACTTLAQGRLIHACSLGVTFESNCVLCNALVNMYARCQSMRDTKGIFDKMLERDVVSWNAMISGLSVNGHYKDTSYFFEQMKCEGVLPDRITFLNMFSTCTSQAALRRGKQAHACMHDNADMVVGNALVTMYGKCGSLEDAQIIFDSMPAHDKVSWGALTTAYAQHGKGNQALHVLGQMQKEGLKPDQGIFASILSACSHTGLVDEGCHCFLSMTQDHDIGPVMDHYICIIDLLGRAGRLKDAENLMNNLMHQSNFVPSMTLLCACKNHFDVERGLRIATYVFQLNPKHACVYVVLSNIYASFL